MPEGISQAGGEVALRGNKDEWLVENFGNWGVAQVFSNTKFWKWGLSRPVSET